MGQCSSKNKIRGDDKYAWWKGGAWASLQVERAVRLSLQEEVVADSIV